MSNQQLMNLEKRIAALELQLENGQKQLTFALDSWIAVLLQFVDDFRISGPRVDALVDELRQMESSSGVST